MVTAIKGNATSTFGGDIDVTGNVITDAPAFSVYLNGSQSISNNTSTKIQFNTEEYDTANAFDSSTNYRFTPQKAGYYQINATCYFQGTSMTNIQLYLYKNGANHKYSLVATGISVGNYQITVSSLVYLNGSTDYIEAYGYLSASSGNAFNGGAAGSTYMTGCLVRAA